MTTPAFEEFLAKLYTDADWRRRFLDDPVLMTRGCGLSAEEIGYLMAIDRVGLALAARTFAYKRARVRGKRFGYFKGLRAIAAAVGRRFRGVRA